MAYRLSYAQLEALVEFLEENPGIAKCLLRTTQAYQETKRKWVNLATSLNALGGANKDGQGIQGWAKSAPAVSPTVDSVPVLAELLDQMDTFSIPSTSHYQATPIVPPSAPLSSMPQQTTPSSEPLPATRFSEQPPAVAPYQDITPRRRQRVSSIIQRPINPEMERFAMIDK